MKLDLGNTEAHHLDKTKSIFSQSLKMIDPDEDCIKFE